MPDWLKYYQQLKPLIQNGYNGLLPVENAQIPEESEVPPVQELQNNYTIQGIPTESRGPGMNDWSSGIYEKSTDKIGKISTFMKDMPGIIGWLGDEIRRTNDAASSTLNASDYDLRNKYSTQGINTHNDLSNLRYDAFSTKQIQDEHDKFNQKGFLNVLSGTYRGFMGGNKFKNDLNSNFKSMVPNASNSQTGTVNNIGLGVQVATTALGALNSIAQNIIGGKKYRSDIGYVNTLNNQNKLSYNNALSDANRNINYNLNTSMNRQRQNTYALGGKQYNSEIAGVTTFNTGNTHELNPYGGIPQGIGENGKPNLVEEGEVKWNDFIFSNRIQPSGDILSKYNTVFNKKFNSYADAANFILDLHKERENNPFDKSTLNVQMQRLADAQEYQKLSEEAAQYGLTPEEYMEYQQQAQQYENTGNTYPEGGQLYYDATKRQIVNTQPQHNYWVPIISGKSGKNYNGIYNFDSPFYSEFWNTLTPEDQATMKDQFKNWYFSESYQPTNIYGTNTPYNKWPNQNISVDGLYNEAINDKWGSVHQAWIDWMYSLMNHDGLSRQDILTTPNRPTVQLQTIDVPDTTNQTFNTETITTANPRYPWYSDALRAAPILNNLRAILTQNDPDYTYANQIASTYRPVNSYPVGQYQRYQPVDQHYLDTQANQRANTQYGFYRDNTQSASAANAYATLASANQSAAINDAYIRALQTNNQNRNAALQYNNQLDRANEEARRATQAANYTNYANIMGNAYAAAEQERLAVENARETNMQNLAMNLGDLGRELYDRWRINNDPSLSYTTGWKYKQVIPLLNMWADMMNEYNKTTKSK